MQAAPRPSGLASYFYVHDQDLNLGPSPFGGRSSPTELPCCHLTDGLPCGTCSGQMPRLVESLHSPASVHLYRLVWIFSLPTVSSGDSNPVRLPREANPSVWTAIRGGLTRRSTSDALMPRETSPDHLVPSRPSCRLSTAPDAGFEPATISLTGRGSAVELIRKVVLLHYGHGCPG